MLDTYCVIVVNKMILRTSLKPLCHCFSVQGFLFVRGLSASASLLSSVKCISFANASFRALKVLTGSISNNRYCMKKSSPFVFLQERNLCLSSGESLI